jgi:ribosomal protein L37E
MIFRNPAGAPELACDECGCRWFDRMNNACYECGAPMSEADAREYALALAEWRERGPADVRPAPVASRR